MLVGPDGALADTGAQLAVQPLYEDSTMVITASGNLGEADAAIARAEGTSVAGDMVSVTMSEQDTIVTEVRFSDGEDPYSLYVTPRMEAENLAVRALVQMAPWLLLVLLVFSLLCAFGYSRYITRPIVRLSGIAKKWPGWTSTGSAESGAGLKSGSWDAAWTDVPSAVRLPG